MNENEEANSHQDSPKEIEASQARRAFLKQAGRFALYTPPVITLLMMPSYAQILTSSGAIKPKPDDPPPIIKSRPPKPKK